jgi:hypothetical protein
MPHTLSLQTRYVRCGHLLTPCPFCLRTAQPSTVGGENSGMQRHTRADPNTPQPMMDLTAGVT